MDMIELGSGSGHLSWEVAAIGVSLAIVAALALVWLFRPPRKRP